MRLPLCLLCAVLCLAILPAASSHAANDAISFQGRLTSSTDIPVPDASYPATFSLWTDSTGGNLVWTEAQNIQSSQGLFTCQLGRINSFFDVFADFADQQLWMETQVIISGAVQTLSPRLRIASVPMAHGARRMIDDTVSTIGRAMLVSSSTPNTIQMTADISGARLGTMNGGVERAGFGCDGSGYDVSYARVSSYDPLTLDLKGEAKLVTSSLDAGNNSNWLFGSDKITARSTVSDSGGLTAVEVDFDNDGDPDVGTITSAKIPRSVLKQYFQSGDTPTEAQHTDTVSGDGVHSVSVVDLDGDGIRDLVAGRAINDSIQDYLDADSDDDGVADCSMSDQVSSTSASRRLVFVNGSFGDCSSVEVVNATTGKNVLAIQNGTTPTSLSSLVTLDSALISSSQEGGGISSSTNMRTRINDLETKLQNLGLLASTRVTSSCDESSARHAINTEGSGVQQGHSASIMSSTDASTSEVACAFDETSDGTPEGLLRSTITVQGALTLSTGRGGSTTATIRQQATPDSAVIELGYSGSTTATIRLDASASGSANPIEHSSGAHLTSGGVWTNASDEDLKENFQQVDGVELLKRIEDLPISRWNYKVESDEVTHIGPTAQDFSKAFGVGVNDKTISTIDPSGIALAAIKQLSKENDQLKVQVDELRKLVEALAKKK